MNPSNLPSASPITTPENEHIQIVMSDSQWLAIICMYRLSSIISIIGSAAVLYIIVSDHQRKLAIFKNRLMIAISLMDILVSSALAFAMTPIPRESGFYGAIGNTATCDAQGFFIIFGGQSTIMYNAALCIMYVRMIKYNVTNETLINKHMDIKIYAFIFVMTFAYAFVATMTERLYRSHSGCFLESLVFTHMGLPIATIGFIIISVSMGMIYSAIRKQVNDMQRFSFMADVPRGVQRLINEKKETAIQSTLYVGSYFITYLPSLLSYLWYNISRTGLPWVFYLLVAIFTPLQGFWNAVIYIRPCYVKYRNAIPNVSCLKTLRSVIFSKEIHQSQRPSVRRNSMLHV